MDFTPRVQCETCPAIFSRKKCLHSDCPEHKADLEAYRREIDSHIHAMAIDIWHPRLKAPDGSIPSETRTNTVSRDLSKDTTYPIAQTSGDVFFQTTNPQIPSMSPESNMVRAGSTKIFFQSNHSHSLALTSTNFLKQHHVNRGSNSRHMITPRGSVSLTFPTLSPIQPVIVGRSGSVDQSPKTIANGTQMEFLHEVQGKPCFIPSSMDE